MSSLPKATYQRRIFSVSTLRAVPNKIWRKRAVGSLAKHGTHNKIPTCNSKLKYGELSENNVFARAQGTVDMFVV